MAKSFSRAVIEVVKAIPEGKICTYGKVAEYAGNKKAARQVSYILNSFSGKENIPWYRVINSRGKISLPEGGGYKLQKEMLINEGIKFDDEDKIDLNRYLWKPSIFDF